LLAEPEYTKAFLLTHHAFTSSRVVLDYVIKRYYAYGEEIAREPDQEPSKPEGGGKESSKKDDKKISKGDKEDEICTCPTNQPPHRRLLLP